MASTASIRARSAYRSANTAPTSLSDSRSTSGSPAAFGPTGTALTTSSRRVPSASIADTIRRVSRSATPFAFRPREPSPESTASRPATAARTAASSSSRTTPCSAARPNGSGSRSGSRTTAVTS